MNPSRSGSSSRNLTWYRYLGAVCMLLVMGGVGAMAQEEMEIPGYMRVDTDALGTQFWFGATHRLGNVEVSSDIYLTGTTGEFDIGPSFAVGPVTLLPMVGIVFDYGTMSVTTLVAPQLFTTLDLGDSGLYFESWMQFFLSSPFDAEGEDSFYTRDFLLYSLSDIISIGPQMEATVALGDEQGLTGLAIGGRVNLGYGANNTLGIFLGYETQKAKDSDGITGRMTFVRSW